MLTSLVRHPPGRCTGYDELTLLSPVSGLFSTLHAPFPEGRARGLCSARSILSVHSCPPLTGPPPLTPGAQTLPDAGSRTWLLGVRPASLLTIWATVVPAMNWGVRQGQVRTLYTRANLGNVYSRPPVFLSCTFFYNFLKIYSY